MYPGPLGHSITGRALEKNLWSLHAHDIRDHATDNHKTVDDIPYGGGAGMLMKPDVVAASIRQARQQAPQGSPVVYLTPGGEVFNQNMARDFAALPGLILLCGHYEGIDQRVIDTDVDRQISLGNFVLTGGEIATFTVLDAVVRLLPDVLGSNASLHEESFDILDEDGTPLVEYPHYTRPAEWEGLAVPEVLRSGHHENIRQWRLDQAKKRTRK